DVAVDFSHSVLKWGVNFCSSREPESCRPYPNPTSTVAAGFEGELAVAADQLTVTPVLLRPLSYRAMATAPRRAPDSFRRKIVASGAIAISSFSPSRKTEVPARVRAWPKGSKAALYSVRPQMIVLPSGVYRIADGMVKFRVGSDQALFQSISIVPGSVMRVLTWRRFRSVIFDGLLRGWAACAEMARSKST